MKNLIFRVMAIVFFLLITLSTLTSAESQKIILSTLEWEPYIGANLPSQGYVAEIVREAFKREGVTVEFQYYPWTRTVDMAKKGQVDGYFPEYYAKDVEGYAQFSKPFPGGPVVLFKRSGEKIIFKSLEDLKPYRIGVVRGYVNEEKFDKATFLNKDEAVDDQMNINKLLNKRIDLFVCDKFVGLSLIKKHFPNQAGQIDYVDPELINHQLYVCFSKNAKNYQQKCEIFNRGLKKITDDGTVKKILKKHGF